MAAITFTDKGQTEAQTAATSEPWRELALDEGRHKALHLREEHPLVEGATAHHRPELEPRLYELPRPLQPLLRQPVARLREVALQQRL